MREKQDRGELLRSIGSGDLPDFLLDGRAQVGMLYVSEARQLNPAQIRTIELPPEEDLHERIRFVVAPLTEAGRPFASWLVGSESQAQLIAAGFGPRR